MTTPDVEAFFDPATHTVTYLVSDPATGAAAVIDPVLDYEPASGRTRETSVNRVIEAAAARGLTIVLVLETHAHADHLTGARLIAARTGAPVGIGERITEVQETFAPLFGIAPGEAGPGAFDLLLHDGDSLSLGTLSIRVLHTPGHTPACVSYVIGDAVFVGDTLFMPDFGTARTDFPGGDARTLYRSVHRILSLPGETRVFVGHDYLPAGRESFAWETTVGEQRAGNIHVGDTLSEDDFVRMREARDAGLPAPALILPALQVNIRGGDLPAPEANGRTYLKIPLDSL